MKHRVLPRLSLWSSACSRRDVLVNHGLLSSLCHTHAMAFGKTAKCSANRNSDSFCCAILHRMRDWDGYLQTLSLLGHGHMSHFTWAGSNANEQKLLLLFIWIGWSLSFQHGLNVQYCELRCIPSRGFSSVFEVKKRHWKSPLRDCSMLTDLWGFFSPGTMQLMLKCAVAWDPVCVEIVCAKRLG